MNKNKIVIVINGKGGVGKDTLCDIIIKHYKARKISSITPILKIARENGWDGTKTPKSRKFLSDLKRAFVEFNNLPNTYLVEEQKSFLKSDDDILFVHIRESDQISEFLDSIKGSCISTSLLIKRTNPDEPALLGNVSDDNVEDYTYEYTYNNTKSIEEAEADFMNYFEYLISDITQKKNI